MELAEEEDSFHVFGYLKKLRQSRKGLIENVVSCKLAAAAAVLHYFAFATQITGCPVSAIAHLNSKKDRCGRRMFPRTRNSIAQRMQMKAAAH